MGRQSHRPSHATKGTGPEGGQSTAMGIWTRELSRREDSPPLQRWAGGRCPQLAIPPGRFDGGREQCSWGLHRRLLPFPTHLDNDKLMSNKIIIDACVNHLVNYRSKIITVPSNNFVSADFQIFFKTQDACVFTV